MKRAILSAALAIAFVAGVSAQDRPNFVGTWNMDPARSDRFSGSAPLETITVHGSRMTITRTRGGDSASTVYMLDGTPSKNRVGHNAQIELTYNNEWEDNVLVTTIATATSTRVERRSIEPDGTMKVELTLHIGGRVETRALVFTKIE